MKTASNFLLTATCIIMLLSFKGGEVKPLKNAARWIPADFDVRTSTLMVQCFLDNADHSIKARQKVNVDMKKYLAEAYPHKYEMITTAMLEEDKYADKDAFRYVLMLENGTSTHDKGLSTGSGMVNDPRNSMESATNRFHIHDRKLNKHYPDTFYSTSYVMPIFKSTLATILAHHKTLKK